jgi:hypothetical protein
MVTPTLAECQQEIESLHDFFVAWYCGEPAEFSRLSDALGPEFEMIHPDGERVSRKAILESIRETEAAYDPGEFTIDIRNVEAVDIGDDYAVLRYEEWQTTPDGENGRLSTVLFDVDSDAPNELAWVTVHETWLEN